MTLAREIPSNELSSGQGAFLFVGQAGCQIGSALWTLFNAEHGIQPDGFGVGDIKRMDHVCFYKGSVYYAKDEFHRTFCYQEMKKSGKFVPRTLFVDLEPSVIDEIRHGCYRNLFSGEACFYQYSHFGDGSGIFSRAYNTIGRQIIVSVMNSIRHLAEKSSRLTVFSIARSYGGSTGSGLGSLILEKLHDQYPKVLLTEANIMNSDPFTSHTVEPYNTLFGIESSCTGGGISFLYNNRALENVCYKRLRIKKPLFQHMNQLLCQGISGMYSSERFPGYGSCNIDSIITNLIPFPRVQLAICSMAPIIPRSIMSHEPCYRPEDLIDNILSEDYSLFDIDPSIGAFISCCMLYRGNASPRSIASSHQLLVNENRMKFVEWTPRGIKSGHSPLSVVDVPGFELGVSHLSMTMLYNHTNISDALARECLAVHAMLKRKAFIHWYIDHGMEEEDFNSALENAMLLALDYKEVDDSSENLTPSIGNLHEYETDEFGNRKKKKNVRKIDPEQVKLLFSSQDKTMDVLDLEKYMHLSQSLADSVTGDKQKLDSTFGTFNQDSENSLNQRKGLKGFQKKNKNLVISGKDTETKSKNPTTNRKGSAYRPAGSLLPEETLQPDENDDVVSKEVVNEMFEAMTSDDKGNIISLLESGEFDDSLPNGVDKNEIIALLIDGPSETNENLMIALDNLFQMTLNLEFLPSETVNVQATHSKNNRKSDADIAIQLLDDLTLEDREKIISLIESGQYDENLFNGIDKQSMLSMISDWPPATDVGSIKLSSLGDQMKHNTKNKRIDREHGLMVASHPTDTPVHEIKYQRAVEKIEPHHVIHDQVRSCSVHVRCSLITSFSYDESFVRCIDPKTNSTNVRQFYKHYPASEKKKAWMKKAFLKKNW